METNSERRRAKLAALCDRHGLVTVAARAGLNPATLDQILKGVLLPPKKDGSRSQRGLGNPAVKAIEAAFWLGRGWFDAPDSTIPDRNQFAGLTDRTPLVQTQPSAYPIHTPPPTLSDRALDLAKTYDRLTREEDQQDIYIECIKMMRARLSSTESATPTQSNGTDA